MIADEDRKITQVYFLVDMSLKNRTEVQNLPIQIDHPGLFQGVYSYPEAARLIGVTSQRIMRWADGYTFPLKGTQGASGPILQGSRYKGAISFAELIELFFVREYTALNVTLQHIRATSEALASEVGPLPFSKSRVLVSGRELIVKSAEGVFNRPDIGQLVADYAVDFAKHIEIRAESAARYTPDGFEGKIYLDKEIHSGEAVVSKFAIPTRMIYALWKQEQNIKAVAMYHDISTIDVSTAVRYEGQWRLAA